MHETENDEIDSTFIFQTNLQHLCEHGGSKASIAREIGISNVQLSRFLNGHTTPKPHILYRICKHFKVDARILVEPLPELTPDTFHDPEFFERNMNGKGFLITENDPQYGSHFLENGLHSLVRPTTINKSMFAETLVHVYTDSNYRVVKGLEAHVGNTRYSGTTDVKRQLTWRGFFFRSGNGFGYVLRSHVQYGGMGGVTFFDRYATLYGYPFISGVSTLFAPLSRTHRNIRPMILQPLPQKTSYILAAARRSGHKTIDELSEAQRQYFEEIYPDYVNQN